QSGKREHPPFAGLVRGVQHVAEVRLEPDPVDAVGGHDRDHRRELEVSACIRQQGEPAVRILVGVGMEVRAGFAAAGPESVLEDRGCDLGRPGAIDATMKNGSPTGTRTELDPTWSRLVMADALTRQDVRSSDRRNDTEPRPVTSVVTVSNRSESRKSVRSSSPPPPVVSPPSPS